MPPSGLSGGNDKAAWRVLWARICSAVNMSWPHAVLLQILPRTHADGTSCLLPQRLHLIIRALQSMLCTPTIHAPIMQDECFPNLHR